MCYLFIFIIGIVFIRCVLPICDQAASWVLTAIEYKKTQIIAKTAQLEVTIQELSEEKEIKMPQIGFVINDEPVNEEDEDDN